ncbi:DUF357 domain-containing protein [Candidatus Marsarchaeota archaeon]|nr:DUF357 domain-containing protein [Candidatus Marsarchaeota archaeon]
MPSAEPKDRVLKDISMFRDSLELISGTKLDGKMSSVVEMAKLYASDAQSYLDKGDILTAFSCISYAHGLMDSILSLVGLK